LGKTFCKFFSLKAQLLLGFFFYYSCSNSFVEHSISGITMGTSYKIKIIEHYKIDKIQKIKNSIDSILVNLNQQMSTWIIDSEISLFNHSRATDYYKISNEFYHVLEQGKLISNQTLGAFDYSVFPLVRLWGFGPEKNNSSMFPGGGEIKKVLEYVGQDKVILKYPYIKKSHPKVQIDLNAIAKGYAVDIIHNWLIFKNHKNIYVEIGGEIRCNGVNKMGSNWTIGIDAPLSNYFSGQKIYTTTRLENMSLATSGNYRNFLDKNGKKISHSIDPRNGMPVETNVLSVSVKARSCLVADAWATALMVLSFDDGLQAINRAEELEVLWILSKDQTSFSQFSTEGFFNK
jgi:thiamine biosynthesis lipoprotein